MKSITELSKNELAGKRVLLRLDLNVPVQDGVVMDDFRIVSALPTLKFLEENGAEITVIAHCESNHGEKCTLDPAAAELRRQFGKPLTILPNLRDNQGEKNNDPEFAKELAALGDLYVNDAFSVSHRAHASIVGVPRLLPSYAGIQLEKEVKALSQAFNPPHPFLFILGGAKFETKMPLIANFMEKADQVFIGGALANDLLKAEGKEVGQSLVSKEVLDLSHLLANPKLIKVIDTVEKDGVISDIGPETMKVVEAKVKEAAFILWNGPLGNTEAGFTAATEGLARAIAESSAESVVGGGDTLSSIKHLDLEKHFSFISTGGGATLDFLANGTIPGIEALA